MGKFERALSRTVILVAGVPGTSTTAGDLIGATLRHAVRQETRISRPSAIAGTGRCRLSRRQGDRAGMDTSRPRYRQPGIAVARPAAEVAHRGRDAARGHRCRDCQTSMLDRRCGTGLPIRVEVQNRCRRATGTSRHPRTTSPAGPSSAQGFEGNVPVRRRRLVGRRLCSCPDRSRQGPSSRAAGSPELLKAMSRTNL